MIVVMVSILLSLLIFLVGFKLNPPINDLSQMLAPYDSVARVRLNDNISTKRNINAIGEIFKPISQAIAHVISSILSIADDDATALRLNQAGIDQDLESYRVKTIKQILLYIFVGLLLGAGLGSMGSLLFFPIIFAVIGISKSRSKIDNVIEQRKRTIKYELYSINQLLTISIRTGSGIHQSLEKISSRTNGIVADEFRSILNRTRSGMPLEESLYLSAKQTPEAYLARTFKLLAASSQRGADLTQGLLDLAQDLRRSLREDIRSNSTKKRAAMLIPTIGILAPIMLLFVAAPIPSIVLGGN